MAISVVGVLLLCVCMLDMVSGSCPHGTYGYKCGYHCHCPLNQCNADSGCSTGDCDAGWSGPTCQKDIVRRNGIQMYISNTAASPTDGVNCYTVTGNRDGTDIPDVLKVMCSGKGRYLVLYTTTVNNEPSHITVPIMDFCEVEVGVCSNGTFGADCDNYCHCDGEVCDYVSGICPRGVCLPGWTTETCDTECKKGHYGTNCTKICSARKCKGDNSSCDHVTGDCTGGCMAGWKGTDCTQKCVHSYGEGCSKRCSVRSCQETTPDNCDHVAGRCEKGCKPGWKKIDCTEECEKGHYGPNCTKICSTRKCKGDNSSCDHVTGDCTGGCMAGWKGTDCTQKCVHSYGEGCSKRCSVRSCQETTPDNCDHVTGRCEKGCKPGWKKIDCTEECKSGHYGANCTKICSTRNCKGDNSSCDHVTGECTGGCMAGWKGTDCIKNCKLGTYGATCTGVCGQCLDVTVCHHVNGTCLRGCREGWTNHNCAQKLVDGPSMDVGLIAGCAVAVLVAAALVAFVIVVFVRRRRNGPKKSENSTRLVHIRTEDTEEIGVDNPVPVLGDDEDDVEVDHNATYYNIARAPAVTAVSVYQLGERIKELQEPVGGFQAEYLKLSKTFTRPYNDSQLEENKGKNRYISYYPYDDTRVVLKELPGQPGSDYINASYIDGHSQPQAYIAAQAPKPNTLTDFWRMIWEKNCTRIVMLTNLMEMGRVKCEPYWSDTSDMHVGDFTISVTGSSIRAHWVVRELQVTEGQRNTTRCFYHFHFTTWPDHGIPDVTALNEFLWLVRASDSIQGDHQLVHCSAGVGRTGTYIALNYLLDQALTEDAVDVLGCVSRMRDQRKGMTQNKEQYMCVYMALYETLQFGNTAVSVEEFKRNRDIQVTFTTGRMAVAAFIETVNTQRKEACQDTSVKGRVWINGRSDIMAVRSRSHLSMNGYLLTEAPSVTTASLFWKLTEEQESATVIVLPDSHQSLSSFIPSPGHSLELGPVTVRCSTQIPVNTDITLLNIHRQIEDAEPTLVHVYILNILPEGSPSTLLELLEELDRRVDVSPNTVTVIYSDDGRQNAAIFCILRNIVQCLKYDKRGEIYNNMRAMVHCLDQDITQDDVVLCYDVATAYLESQNIYANM